MTMENEASFHRAIQRLLLHMIVASLCAEWLLMPLKQALVFINREEMENVPFLPHIPHTLGN